MARRRWLNRELVIEKGVEIADGAGSVTAVSLTAVAQALDVRPPSLYNHVASLEDLQHGMRVWGLRQLLADLRQAALGLAGREALAAIAQAYRAFVLAHPGLYPLTIRAPQPDDEEVVALSQELVQLLLLVMASLALGGDDAIHAIRGLRAVLHGFTSLEAAGGFGLPLEREESFRRLVATYLDGL